MLHNSKKSFTLIELLVVIAIIGLLTGIIIIGLKDALARGRDAKRIAEVNGISKALELYHADYDKYPIQDRNFVCIEEYPDFASEMKPYLPTIPQDPLYPQKWSQGTDWIYCYYYRSLLAGKEYMIFLKLEKGTCRYYTVHSGASCVELLAGIYSRYNTSCGNPCYAPIFDLKKDGSINVSDVSLLFANWGDEDWCADKLKDTSNPCQ